MGAARGTGRSLYTRLGFVQGGRETIAAGLREEQKYEHSTFSVVGDTKPRPTELETRMTLDLVQCLVLAVYLTGFPITFMRQASSDELL